MLCLSLPAHADSPSDMKALIEQGHAPEAYKLGSNHPELMGEPSFDFIFGVAAIDSGHAPEGVMALERHLIAHPESHQTRLELARGYFVLGEDARARDEFEAVLTMNPPADVVANVQHFMDAIRAREARYQTSARGYVEAGLAMDSNINGGVSSSTIVLPVLGAVQVGSTGQRQGDWVNLFGAGAQVIAPIEPGVMLFGGVDWEVKDMAVKGEYSTESVSVNAGESWLAGDHQLKLSTSLSTLHMGHNHYRDVGGIGAEWQLQLNETQMVNVGLQFAQIRYAGSNRVRDSDISGVTAGFRQALALDWQPVVTTSISVADDENRRDRRDLGRMMYSARVGITASPAPKWGLSAGLTYQESRYKDADLLLATRRKDSFANLDFSVSYLIDRSLSLRADASLIDNSSDVALYAFRRSALGLKLRYDMK